MTKQEIIEAIKVMQDFIDGKRIEVSCNNDWAEVDDPSWDWNLYKYRTKQKTIKVARALVKDHFGAWQIPDRLFKNKEELKSFYDYEVIFPHGAWIEVPE